MLIKYTNPLVKLNPSLNGELLLDETFALEVDKLVDIGVKYGITLFINSGFRKNSDHIQNAIVTPAKKSNHFVGHACDANLIYANFFYTSQFLANPPSAITSFINEWKALGNRYGGDFTPIDLIHFDDDLFHRDPEKWKELYAEYHS